MDGHSGDCTIYSALANDAPEDGICTCGYGLGYGRSSAGHASRMYSKELQEKLLTKAAINLPDGLKVAT